MGINTKAPMINVCRWTGSLGRRLGLAVCGAIAAVGISAVATPAAENLEIRYGALGVDMSVDDLEAFVAGEETSARFRNLVRQIETYANVSPETLKMVLGLEINVETLGLNRVRAVNLLYSFIGKRILKLGSRIIHPPLNPGNVPALRGAIALSLMDDGKISIVEVLRRYGVSHVQLDAGQAREVVDELQDSFSGLQDFLRN